MQKYYIYRFLNDKEDVLYIGKTINLQSRIEGHFTHGHLKKAQYKQVVKVEYMICDTESNQHVIEIYLINKYKPVFNTSDKKKDNLTLKIDIEENWVEMIEGTPSNIYKELDDYKLKLKESNKRNNELSKELKEVKRRLENLYSQDYTHKHCMDCGTSLRYDSFFEMWYCSYCKTHKAIKEIESILIGVSNE